MVFHVEQLAFPGSSANLQQKIVSAKLESEVYAVAYKSFLFANERQKTH